AMDAKDGLVIILHLVGERADIAVICARGLFLRRLRAFYRPHIAAPQSRRPVLLESHVRQRAQHEDRRVRLAYGGEALLDPSDVRGLALGLLGIHFRRAASVVVAADGMEGGEDDAALRPGEVLAELLEARVLGLALDRKRFLSEALA